MATKSFTLRKTTVGYGSYVQGTGTDTALRSDAVIANLAILDTGQNSISANVIDTESVLLSWELSFSFVTSASTPNPIAMRIVASPTGEPVTVKDGVTVVNTNSNTINTVTDVVRVPQGRWVYYSLFIQWSDFDSPETTWYERAATLYVQIPKAHNSVDNLWARVPEYYRNLDYQQNSQPLYNFIELFGWEIDRTRTLIETLALSNDPDLAVTPALKELAYETGLEFSADTLGTTKARAVLNNIGYIRRRKGTTGSISTYLSALTGCQITYEYASPDYKFKVHSQRVNFITDPKFSQALGSATTGTTPYPTTKRTSSTYGVYTYADSSPANSPSVSALSDNLIVSVPSGGSTPIVVTVYARNSFPRWNPAYYYTSFDATYTGGASFSMFDTQSTLVWDSLSAGQKPTYTFTAPSILPTSTTSPSSTRVEIAPLGTTETTTTAYPYLVFVVPPGGSVTLTKWMVEANSIGDYFDGDTREGGLIPSITGNGQGVSDYRWANPSTPSFSYYMLDYQRVATLAVDIIKNYIASVLIKDNVVIEWDYYYGKT